MDGLIRQVDLQQQGTADVRIHAGRIAAIAPALVPRPGEALIEGQGHALLPALHDHHLHLWAAAAALQSVACDPTRLHNSADLSRALRAAGETLTPGAALRGIGWHESVMDTGDALDRDWLDRHGPDRPVRIQHRSGRLWIFNSRMLDQLQVDASAPAGFERVNGRLNGRLLDGDAWLRARQPDQRPDLSDLSRRLASYGVVGVTDTTPDNHRQELARYAQACARGELLQDLRVMGDASLDHAQMERLQIGEAKFHLHEHQLPAFDELVAAIRARHRAGRGAAFHATSRIELVYALSALEAAGSDGLDRIEHAGVTPPELIATMQALRLTVISQPHFIVEKGRQYRRDVDAEDQPWLYRLQAFHRASIGLAAGSDAPFGGLSPWQAMQAAVERRDQDGVVIGADESLSPEQALALYSGPLHAPAIPVIALANGHSADLCLLDRSWGDARTALAEVRVRLTLRAGRAIHVSPQGSALPLPT